MSEAELKTELRNLIESESDLDLLEAIRGMLQKSTLQTKLTSRAIKSEKDIKAKKVFTREEAEKRLARFSSQ